MTIENLTQANDLVKQITELKSLINHAKNQKCEWIEFTFGNGSNSPSVCNDPLIINQVRNLIVHENELKLERLKKEFSEL